VPRKYLGRVPRKASGRALRCKSSLVPRCGLSTAIAHAKHAQFPAAPILTKA